MKTIFCFLVAAVVGVMGAAQAGVIYDNGVPDLVDSFWSDFAVGENSAEDFSLAPGSNVITDIHWWGGYGLDFGLPDDDFTISIYEDVSGLPAFTPFIDIATDSITRENTGQVTTLYEPWSVYAYSLDIEPLELAADTTYYLSIVNNTPNHSDSWFWMSSDFWSGATYARYDPNSNWYERVGEAAFYLTDDGYPPVPEPATLSLLGMGLVGLILRRKKLRV